MCDNNVINQSFAEINWPRTPYYQDMKDLPQRAVNVRTDGMEEAPEVLFLYTNFN